MISPKATKENSGNQIPLDSRYATKSRPWALAISRELGLTEGRNGIPTTVASMGRSGGRLVLLEFVEFWGQYTQYEFLATPLGCKKMRHCMT